jgi:chorismate synthase
MDAIRDDMNRRRPGYTIISTPRKEADEFEILSGVEKNILNGEPLKMVIQNTNIKSSDYNSILRPGHAD